MRLTIILWTSLASLGLIAPTALGQSLQSVLDQSERLFLEGRLEEAQTLLVSMEDEAAETWGPAERLRLACQRSKVAVFQGILSRDTDHYESALDMLLPLQGLSAEVEPPSLRAAYTTALGYAHIFNTHRSPTHRDTALAHLRKAIDLFAETPDRSGEALARSLEIMLRFTRSRTNRDSQTQLDLIPEFKAEIEFSRRAGNPMALAYNQRHLAGIYRDQSRWDEALKFFRDSLETRRRMGFRPFLPASYFSVGEVLVELGKTEEALESFEQSVKASDQVQFLRYQILSRLELGDLQKNRRQLESARSSYQKALQVAEAGDFHREVEEARKKLAAIP